MKIFSIILTVLSFCFVGFAQQLPDDKVYKDKLFPFSVKYPKDWISVATTGANTRIKVFSNSGLGPADFNIVATALKGTENVSSATFVKLVKENPKLLTDPFSAGKPVKILSQGETYLSNQKAYYIKAKILFRFVENKEVEIKVWSIVMFYQGVRYIFTCRAPTEFYDEFVPTFTRLINTFHVSPK